ncbi:unnamed protein product [Nezara viridula]|uniref:Uncharacterized protein n=1 Tax=Nezara viridula TaxID=85310 RepID=A0A9P0H2L3_NEZVI|nr:unnamed protein product [Nezara viridula]
MNENIGFSGLDQIGDVFNIKVFVCDKYEECRVFVRNIEDCKDWIREEFDDFVVPQISIP